MNKFISSEIVLLIMSRFGQVVLGPPGSGKTTYCLAIASLLRELGREVVIINLGESYIFYFKKS